MADDSLEIQKDDVPFHPCLTPRGMTWYDLNVLTPVQQKLLNELKVDIIRENNKYLARHPEIRALIALFLREVLKVQPKLKTIADFAKDFFTRPSAMMQKEIDKYLKERGEPLKKEGDSAVNLEIESTTVSSLDDLSALYRQGYYSYVSYTEERSSVEEIAEWSSHEDLDLLHRKPESFITESYYSSTTDMASDYDYERRQFELLFASRASLYSGEESLEASTLDMTKQYMTYFDAGTSDVDKHEHLDDEDLRALEEIKMAEDIQNKLSTIIENVEEENEDYEEAYEDYEEQFDKRSLIEMDLESLKEKQLASEEGFEERLEGISENRSVVLETMLEYVIGTEG